MGASIPRLRSARGRRPAAFFLTEIFANLELVPRAADLDSIIDTWEPDVVVHEVAELAAAARRHRPRDPLRGPQLRGADRIITAPGDRRGSRSALAGSRTGSPSAGWPVPLLVRRHVSAFLAVAGDRIRCCGAATSACRCRTPRCRPTCLARAARLGRHRLPDDGDGLESQPRPLPDGDRGSPRRGRRPHRHRRAPERSGQSGDPSPTTCSFTSTSPKACCSPVATL